MSPLNFLLRTHPHAASGDFSAWKMISFKFFRIHTFSKNYESPCCAQLPRSGWLVGGSDTLLIHPSNQSEMGDRDYVSKQHPTLRSPPPVGALEEAGEGRWQGGGRGWAHAGTRPPGQRELLVQRPCDFLPSSSLVL